jgi:hypothetical protein
MGGATIGEGDWGLFGYDAGAGIEFAVAASGFGDLLREFERGLAALSLFSPSGRRWRAAPDEGGEAGLFE